MPNTVPHSGGTTHYGLVERQGKENKSQCNTTFPNLVPEKSADRLFPKEMIHGQLILEELSTNKFLS